MIEYEVAQVVQPGASQGGPCKGRLAKRPSNRCLAHWKQLTLTWVPCKPPTAMGASRGAHFNVVVLKGALHRQRGHVPSSQHLVKSLNPLLVMSPRSPTRTTSPSSLRRRSLRQPCRPRSPRRQRSCRATVTAPRARRR